MSFLLLITILLVNSNPVFANRRDRGRGQNQNSSISQGNSQVVPPASEQPQSPVLAQNESGVVQQVAQSSYQPVVPPTVQSVEPRVIRKDLPSTLLDRKRVSARDLSLPGPLKMFVVALLHVSNIPRHFPDGFAAPWVNEEKGYSELDRGRQVALLQQILEVLVDVYKAPSEYKGPPIATLEEYLSVVAPTQGDPNNSVAQEFEHYAGQLRNGVTAARRVLDPSQFANGEVESKATDREFQNEVYLRAVLKSFLSASVEGNSASYVLEVLVGGFVGALAQNPTGSSAGVLDAVADLLDGKSLVSPIPQRTVQQSGSMAARALRTGASGLRAVSDYPAAEAAFIEFVSRLADLGRHDKHALANVIVAFEKALAKVVDVFGQEARRLSQSNELFSGTSQQKEKQGALLKLFLEEYPLLLPQSILKDIVLDLLVLPIRPDAHEMMDVVLGHAGPLLKNFLQTRTQVARSGGLLHALAQAAQDSGRNIPVPEVRRILKADPNQYIPYDTKFQTITPELVREVANSPQASEINILDPRDKGAGKFFVSFRVIRKGQSRLIKVKRPEAEHHLSVDREIFRFLAPKIGRHFLPKTKNAPAEVLRTRMLRQIDMRTEAMMEELHPELTVQYQRAGRAQFEGKTVEVQTSDGVAEFVFHVPAIEDAAPNSQVLLMDFVEDAVDLKRDFVALYPGLSRELAEYLYSFYFDGMIWDPLVRANERTRGQDGEDSPPILGIANRDSHRGNVMIQLKRAAGKGYSVHVHLIDWGMTSQPTLEDIKQILVLSFGAGVNDPGIISDILWRLSNQGRAPTSTRGRTRDLQNDEKELKSRLYAHVKDKTTQLKQNWRWWGPENWIFNIWLHGILDFPPYLAALHDGITAIDDTVVTLYGLEMDEEGRDPRDKLDLQIMNRMEDKGRWPAVAAATRMYPLRSSFAIARSYATQAYRGCAGLLRVFGFEKIQRPVDPNE